MSRKLPKPFVSEQELRRQEIRRQNEECSSRHWQQDERCKASILDNWSIISAPTRDLGDFFEQLERDPFDPENPVDRDSPYASGHLGETPHVLTCFQRGQPHHMAQRADLRQALRLSQSAPITPKQGRENTTIQLAELTCTPEQPRGISVGMGIPHPLRTPLCLEPEEDLDLPGSTPSRRYTSIGVWHKDVLPSDRRRRALPIMLIHEESKFASQQVEYKADLSRHPSGQRSPRGPRSAFVLKPSMPIVGGVSTQAQGLLSLILDVSCWTVSSLEQSNLLPAPVSADNFVRETWDWNCKSSLMSPPYSTILVTLSMELTHQLIDLLQLNQCTLLHDFCSNTHRHT